MKKTLLLSALVVLLMGILLSFSSADVPSVMSYQGFLTDDAGTALDGDYTLTFAIYNDPTAGDTLWSEEQDVSVRDGLFSVTLGSVSPLVGTAFDGPDVWLGISVNGEELTPRTQFTSQPYSYRVKTIDKATGGTITGDLNIVGNINSTSQITIESTGAGVTIRAGSSIVTVTPSGGVTIVSSDVSISSTGDLNISAANKLSLTANEIEVTAASTELYGTDSLVLNSTSDVMVSGNYVYLDAAYDARLESGLNISIKAGTSVIVEGNIMAELKAGVQAKVEGDAAAVLKGGVVLIN